MTAASPRMGHVPVRSRPSPREERSVRGGLSVRVLLTIVITVVAALGMSVVGTVVYTVERHRIADRAEDRLIDQLDAARVIVSTPPDGGWADAADALAGIMRLIVPGDTGGAVGIIDGEVALVPGIPAHIDPGEDADFIALVVAETAASDTVIGTYRENGVNWAYLAAPVDVEADPDTAAVFVLVYDLDRELAELDTSARAYLWTAAGAVAVIAAVSWFLATRLLRPLRQMRLMADRVSALSLDERIPVRGRDDVSDLARTMNGMLDRLDDAMAAQRRLLGDVGHELKTPLTIVHGFLDVLDPKDTIDIEHTRRLAIDEIERMGRLVADLVDVAALLDDEGLLRAHVSTALLVRTIAEKGAMISGAGIRLGPVADADAELDAARITQAVLQLIQNAVTHGGGGVELSSRIADDRLEIFVRDHGPGIPEEDRARIFERFQRLQHGGRGLDGSGLGLSIVQLIARQHGGEVTVAEAPGGGALFLLGIPLSPPAEEPVTPADAGDSDEAVPASHPHDRTTGAD